MHIVLAVEDIPGQDGEDSAVEEEAGYYWGKETATELIELYYPKVKCLVCGEEASLIEIYAGSYQDDVYGAPKIHKVYRKVTKYCKSEDYEEEIEEEG